MTREEAIRVLGNLKIYHDDDNDIIKSLSMAIEALKERQHGECNKCRYYDGVHGVQGHAPCWHWNIGGVMWNDYSSRFEKEGDEK